MSSHSQLPYALPLFSFYNSKLMLYHMLHTHVHTHMHTHTAQLYIYIVNHFEHTEVICACHVPLEK